MSFELEDDILVNLQCGIEIISNQIAKGNSNSIDIIKSFIVICNKHISNIKSYHIGKQRLIRVYFIFRYIRG